MDLQEIQNKLNTLLAGTERKIVFWYDDDAAYAEDIPNLELAEVNKIWQLNDHNWFETKLLLEERDTGVCKINCVYLHRLFDTPIFRTKKCFRQYCE